MNITVVGRVEFDPMLVPQAAPTPLDSEDRFAASLARAERTANRPSQREEAAPRTDVPTAGAEPVEQPVAEPRDSGLGDPAGAGVEPVVTEESSGATIATNRTLAAEAEPGNETIARQTARRQVAGPVSPIPDSAATKPAGAEKTPAITTAIPVTNPVPGAAAATDPARDPRPAAATPAGEPRAAGPQPRVAMPVLGYRTHSPQALHLAEQARDSVFKQILLRVEGGGAEMRMLLDPPELGELDLRLVVDKGGSLKLSIAAERPELAWMLDKHMHELRSALAAHGLTLAQADVQTQERPGQRSALSRAALPAGSGLEPDAAAEAARPARAGFWSEAGFDFWV
jgi:flagellar hook-length control protein FliK